MQKGKGEVGRGRREREMKNCRGLLLHSMGLFIIPNQSIGIPKSRKLEFLGRKEVTPKAKPPCYADSGPFFVSFCLTIQT